MTEHVRVEGIRAEDVARAVGVLNLARGRRYAQGGAVLFSEWHDAALQLRAVVRGGEGRVYSTIISFDSDGRGGLELLHGQCSCPVGEMCKHVAAAALLACREDSPAPPDPTWESTLEALLPGETAPVAAAGPLAIELTAEGNGRLTARLMRPGSSGWVNGGLMWNRMLRPQAHADHRPDHVALIRELYLLHHAARGDTGFSPYRYYGHGADERTIDLATLTSERLWPLLDEAAAVGLELRQVRRGLGPLEPYGHAALTLDLTRGPDDGPLAIRPALRFAGADGPDPDARAVAFLGGDTAHGVVHVSAAEGLVPSSSRLRLARLDPPVPRALWQAALDEVDIAVPPEALARFREKFGRRLAGLRSVTSSDGSFAAPEIGPPVLVLRAAFEGGHALGLSWQWSYDVDGTDVRAALGEAGGEDYRDVAAERAVLRALDDVPVAWDRFGLRTGRGPAAARLTGLDTVAFTTEALPVLEDTDAVRVERIGEPVDYREVGDELEIGVSTSRVGHRHRLVRPRHHHHRGGTARSRSRTCSPRWPRARPTSCCPTGPTSRSRSRSWSHCAR